MRNKSFRLRYNGSVGLVDRIKIYLYLRRCERILAKKIGDDFDHKIYESIRKEMEL